MKSEYWNKEEHYGIFKLLYKKYNVSIEDIAIILNSNSFTIRKYLKKWDLHDINKAIHKNKIKSNDKLTRSSLRPKLTRPGWNDLRNIKNCENCNWEGKCDRAHIIPRKKGGSFKKSNILVLCPNCHRNFDNGILDLSELIIKIQT